MGGTYEKEFVANKFINYLKNKLLIIGLEYLVLEKLFS